MTLDLVPLFEGKEVRVIERDGDIWIPISDLAAAWGVDRTTPAKIISRNPDVFAGLSRGWEVSSQLMDCVNELGLYLLMGKVSPDRLKNAEARAAIIRFQRWVPELIQQFRRGELSPSGNVELEIRQAKHIAELTGGDLRVFQAAALKKCGLPEYADALLDSVPPVVHGEAATWFTPSQLGERCGLTAREVNSWLYNHGYQYPQGPVWRLQPKGEAHGEEYWFEATSGHREIRIRWRESILIASGLIREQPPDDVCKGTSFPAGSITLDLLKTGWRPEKTPPFPQTFA